MNNSQGLPSGTWLNNGKYQIVSVLGQGTFGLTYLATTKVKMEGNLGGIEVDVKVAVKEFFLRDFNQRDTMSGRVDGTAGELFTDYRRKFAKEARNLTKLSHPGIIKVLEVFDENDTTYYVMEFVEGQTLDGYILLRGALPEAEAIDVITSIGHSLQYMHDCKMVHLDIKPNNIMRKSDGTYRLIDFGLSKTIGADGASESMSTVGLGTPGYAPLEQASYRPDGTFPATLDVYALGATLFKMLTGERPPEPTYILNTGFPVGKLTARNVSAGTIAAIRGAMALAQTERTPTVDSFIRALHFGAAYNESIAVTPLPEESEPEWSIEEISEPTEIADDTDAAEEPKGGQPSPQPAPKPQPKPVPAPEPLPEPQPSPTPKKILSFILVGVAVAIIVGITLVVTNRDDNSDEPIPTETPTEEIVASTATTDNAKAVTEVITVVDEKWKSSLGEAKYTGTAIRGDDGTISPAGQGKAVFVGGDNDGAVFVGVFKDGKLSEGEYTFTDKSKFSGTFRNNSLDKGSFVDAESGARFVGKFSNGSPAEGTWYDKSGQLLRTVKAGK